MNYMEKSERMKHLLTLLLTLCVAVSASSQSYTELFEQSVVALEQDSLWQAEELITQALKAEPSNEHNALLFANLGWLQRRQHRYEEALDSYTYALNFAPLSVPILMDRATLLMEMGREERARVDYSLVLDLDAHNQEALLMRAYIHQRERNYKEAHADYDSLLRVAPKHYQGRLGLATLYQKEQKYESAMMLLNTLVEEERQASSPEANRLAVLYLAKAHVEWEQGWAEPALIDLEASMKANAQLSEAYLLQGQIWLSQGKKRPAKNCFLRARELGVSDAELREWMLQCK